MNRVEVILNPNAGQGQLLEVLDVIRERLQKHFESVTFFQTEKPGDGAQRVRKSASHVDLIIAAGGDGTIHELANAVAALKGNPPCLAILPGGTCNDFSRALGMDQDPLKALDQILKKKKRKVDVGYSSQGRYFLNFWGIGFITEASHRIHSENKAELGRLAYYFGVAENMWNHEPFHLRLRSAETIFDGEASILLLGNGSFIGGVESFFPQSRWDDGMLDVLLIKEISLASISSVLVSNLTKRKPEQKDVLYFRTKELSIFSSPCKEIDCDGEKGEFTPAEVKILPKHLTMLTGDEKSPE